jgi:acetylornithine deacetylase
MTNTNTKNGGHLNTTDLAADLVRIGSVNPAGQDVRNNSFGEAALAGRIKAILRTLGATSVETTYPLPGRPNVTGYFDFGATQTILFEAHLDTVPTSGMSIDPFAADIRDGKLWGRGACDVKGPMAAMLTAIGAARQSGRARYNVLFAAVCDEESGFAGVRHLLQNLPLPVTFAVIAEPTDLQPLAAHKGVARWNLTTRGLAAHSSTPHLGRNAIYTMADALLALRTHANQLTARAPHAQLGAPTLSVGVITGGSAVNVVPDTCTIQIDRRLVPGETPASAETELRAALAEFADISLSEPIVAAPAFSVSEESPAVKACLAAAHALGVSAVPEYANYCTDASFYPGHEIPAVVFGPGSIAQAHTADEFIEIAELERGAEAYLHILRG